MPGLEKIPLRIPDKWDPAWFEQFVREVLALADARNALPGPGISVTGNPNEPATISGSADVEEIADANYVVAEASSAIANARVLAGETGVINIEDGGAGQEITVAIVDHSIVDTKLRRAAECSVIGNAANAFGAVADIAASTNGTVLQRLADALTFAALTLSMLPMTGPGKLVGRHSSGAGGAEEITIGTGLSLVGNTLNASAPTPDAGDIAYTPTAPLTATDVQAALDEVAALLALGGGVVLGIIVRLLELSPLWDMAITYASNPNDGLRNFAEITFI